MDAATGLPKEKEKKLEFERESTRLCSVKNSLWKGLWTCHKTIYNTINA